MENLSKRELEKQNHEKEIISAAEKVFCRDGYEDASMDEISKEAQFTKRTVYQHFDSKEELYFAAALKGYQFLLSELKKAEKKGKTGFEKLELTCRYFYKFCKDNPEIFQMISYWGFIKKKTIDKNTRKNQLIQMNDYLSHDLAEMIEEGKADGSIQPDIDSEKTAYSLTFLMTGFFHQISVTDD
ncbi:MAG: TetR/AcrR family transcriptional regulator, partial [Bacillota bacterium]